MMDKGADCPAAGANYTGVYGVYSITVCTIGERHRNCRSELFLIRARHLATG